MFCSNCGNKVNDGAKFCVKCGARLNVGEPSVTIAAPSPAPESAAPAPSPSPAPLDNLIFNARGTYQSTGYYYDADLNYSAMPRYQVVYMTSYDSIIYDMYGQAYGEWADRMNCEYAYYTSNNDSDLFMTTLVTYIEQGVDGFILDPDTYIFQRAIEVMEEAGTSWMTTYTKPLDEYGFLMHPFVCTDNRKFGEDMALWAIDYAKKTWPEAEESKIGMISMDFSVSPEIHDRTIGAEDVWNNIFAGYQSNFFIADGGVTYGLDMDSGTTLVLEIITDNPHITYWLITAFYDDFAMGAVQAAEMAGLEDTVVVVDVGGATLINQWDSGIDSCWKASIYNNENIYVEPVFCGLYAMMSGMATPETLWPDCKSPGSEYAVVAPASIVMTKDNYREYLEWTDASTGGNLYNYSGYRGTEYPVTYHRDGLE